MRPTSWCCDGEPNPGSCCALNFTLNDFGVPFTPLQAAQASQPVSSGVSSTSTKASSTVASSQSATAASSP